MATTTDDLRDIFLDVAADAEPTERQQEEPSRDPVGDDERRLAAEIEAGARRDGWTTRSTAPTRRAAPRRAPALCRSGATLGACPTTSPSRS